MKCPYCGFGESKVIDSRPAEDGTSIRRRRECLKCQKRFTTYEKYETIAMIVVKQDNSRQPYDREKIVRGLIRACEQRPITYAQMEAIADKIEGELYQSATKEVTSTEIGELVMHHLKELDEVAYVRFASVHKHFSDIYSFMTALRELLEEK